MDALAELIGRSREIETVRAQIRRLLERRGSGRLPPVLIQGETGTGKGLVARLIHRAGPRAGGPFIEVNCAAIPETLLEAELFGFERGAFTDARQAKTGLFQAAHRGTIFLDEIGLLPRGLQGKLLGVIEDRVVRRLGSTQGEPVDVWILAATNEDLAGAARQRRFREDLYHRLAVLTLALPALRERREDILGLAEHFLERACREYGLPPKTFADDARRALVAYGWSGNVRELGNVVERVALLADAPVVTAEMLALPAASIGPPGLPTVEAAAPSLAREVEGLERARLADALAATGWNVSRAAVRLGISRNQLRYRIEKYEVRLESGRRTRPRQPGGPAEAAQGPGTPGTPNASGVRWERRRLTLLRARVDVPPAMEGHTWASSAVKLLVEKAQTFGGRVEELSPLGIVAVFGLEPVEDASRWAAHAAMAIQKAAERARRSVAEPVAVRMALHVDHCLVGLATGETQLDPDARRTAWAVLETLLEHAPADAIVVSEGAASLLERRFDLVPLAGPAPPDVGRVSRLVGRERPGLVVGGRMATFVGRQQELQFLKSRVGTAGRGRGQAVGIVGEAGMGKSRLVFELRQWLRGQDVAFVRGHCLSYGRTIPYLPVIDILRHMLRIAEGDDAARLTHRVESTLHQLGIDPAAAAPYLLELLGVRQGTERLAVLSDEAIRSGILDTLRRMILAGCRQRPAVYVVEDVHWIDKASEECLGALVEHLAGAPVLLVTTYRPGYRPPWVDKSYATQIALQPLAPDEGLELVRSLVGNEHVAAQAVQSILDAAEGNPFFLEELSRAGGEPGSAGATLAPPATIQEVLLARIDRLPAETRRFLQRASALGREFSRRLVDALGEGEADRRLDELVRLEFLREQSRPGEPVYVFRHPLIQEVAYESLSVGERHAIHAAAARALETLYAGRLSQVFDHLAHHYSHTEDSAKAVEYLTRAAERAARSYAHAEAVRALQAARGHVNRLPAPERDQRLFDLLLREASSLIPLGRSQEALDLLLRQQDALERRQDPGLAGRYYFVVSRASSFLGDYHRAAEHAHRAIAEAGRCGDEATMGKAYSVLTMEAPMTGRAQQGIEWARQAIALLERADERWWLGHTHWAMGLNYSQVGEFEAALQAEGRAHAIGEAMSDPRLQAYAAWVTGIIYAAIGETAAGIAACRRAVERSTDPLNTAIATGFLGYAYLEHGEAPRAIALLERATRRLAEFGYRVFQGWFDVFLAEALRQEGQAERAQDLALEGLVIARGASFQVGVGWAQQVLGRIALGRGAVADAGTHLAAARETFTTIQSRYELGRTHLDLAALAHAGQDPVAVAGHLRAAGALFMELRVLRYVERTADLARRLGAPVALAAASSSRSPRGREPS